MMKEKWTILVFVIVVVHCSLTLTSKADGAQIDIQWEFNNENVHMEKSGPYTRVFLKDGILPEDKPGTPELPVKYVNVLIPAGAVVTDIEIRVVTEMCIDHDALIYPVQEPQPVSEPAVPFVNPDPEAYASEREIPVVAGSCEGIHRFHGYSFLSIRLNPVRYIPVKRELYLATCITANITYETKKIPGFHHKRHSRVSGEVMRMVSNPWDIERFYNLTPAGVDAVSKIPALSETSEENNSAVYLLVTSEELAPAFEVLVNRRTAEGLSGKLISVEQIYTEYVGVDKQEQIRNCIKQHYENHGTIYVTLGGDDTIIPDRDCYVSTSETHVRTDMPTDLYYGGLDGTWDEDEDGIYGEAGEDEADIYPEVWVGRIPVRTTEQAGAYIDKLIRYEEASPEGFSNTMILAGMTAAGGYKSGTERQSDYLDHDPVSGGEGLLVDQYRNKVQKHWQATPLHKLIDTISSWDQFRCGDYDLTAEHFSECLNWGYHHVFFYAHGTPTRLVLEAERRNFWVEDALALTNRDRPSIMYIGGCSTGAFDLAEPSISEALLRNPDGGAVAYIGSSRTNWSTDAGFYYQLFANQGERLGEAFALHKMSWAGSSAENGTRRWLQFSKNLQADSALRLLPEETLRDLHISSPDGCEVIQQGSDLFIRWNASGTDFGIDELVKLDYSPDSGQTWYPIPGAKSLPFNGCLFVWENCPLPVGSEYRVRVTSVADPGVSDISRWDFTIGELGLLTVRSSHNANIVRIEGQYGNKTNYNITVLRGHTVTLTAPQHPKDSPELAFIRWSDGNRNTLSIEQEYTFTFIDDTTVVAEYGFPTGIFYVNDEFSENGISAGNDDNDGKSPQTPMRHIQALLDKYPALAWGDVIEVSTGTYNENITLDATNIGLELRGAGRDATIIDGNQKASCIYLSGFGNGLISNLNIQNGYASRGGGIYCDNSSPMITNCAFVGNVSETYGGAIFADRSSQIKVSDCIFFNNSSSRGGAICNYGATAEFASCLFEHNYAHVYGGAIHNTLSCSTTLGNCVFCGNKGWRGGALSSLDERTYTTVTNCTFTGNFAWSWTGRGIVHIGAPTAVTVMKNCILWNEATREETEVTNLGQLDISFSIVRCGRQGIDNNDEAIINWGEGNIDVDPLFVRPGYWADANDVSVVVGPGDPNAIWVNGDYHLKSQAGRWDPAGEIWVQDDVTSPCIDAGDPGTDWMAEPFPNGERINMGAYGGMAEASMSWGPQ